MDHPKVVITKVSQEETKEGKIPYLLVTLKLVHPLDVEDNSKEFYTMLFTPHEGMSERENLRAKYQLQEFMKDFDLDISKPFSPENDWIGKSSAL